mmetsp:Transcript_20346/g.57897  ORF Transcript_20346/g.57897 Transcript_20346/m.57897 type:complete len:361 (+) Transcript_20346:326-1408(+)
MLPAATGARTPAVTSWTARTRVPTGRCGGGSHQGRISRGSTLKQFCPPPSSGASKATVRRVSLNSASTTPRVPAFATTWLPTTSSMADCTRWAMVKPPISGRCVVTSRKLTLTGPSGTFPLSTRSSKRTIRRSPSPSLPTMAPAVPTRTPTSSFSSRSYSATTRWPRRKPPGRGAIRASGSRLTQSSEPSSRSSNLTVTWKPSVKFPMMMPGVPCLTPTRLPKMTLRLAATSCQALKPPRHTSSSPARSSTSSRMRSASLPGMTCSIAATSDSERAGSRKGSFCAHPPGHLGMPAEWTLVRVHWRRHPRQKDLPQQARVVGSSITSSQMPQANSSTRASSVLLDLLAMALPRKPPSRVPR